MIPLDHVVVNITHYLMIAYNHSHRALDGIEDERTRETLVNGLRAMQLAWGQADALSLALERAGSTHCYPPFRGHARSHRNCAMPETCAVPVGAGEPAKPAKPVPSTTTLRVKNQ
nr:hypothetical protein [Pseudomonas sp.]